MDRKEGLVRDGGPNIQNGFLKSIHRSSESVYSEECAGIILKDKKRLTCLFCIPRVNTNLSFSRD